MVDQPLVSVLTPSFNQARWLRDNLQSVARQTYASVEHVVIDGGSSDESIAILEGYGKHIVWRSEPDGGQSEALNKAFAASSGEIIGWLNSDDAYFSRSAIEKAVKMFDHYPNVDVVYGHAVLVNANSLILQMIWVPPFNYHLLRFGNFINQPGVFLRRRALRNGFIDESYASAMDRELWLRLATSHKFMRADALLAVDRHHLQRKGLTRPDLAAADKKRLVRAYRLNHESRHRAIRKAWKIMCRLFGVRLIAEIDWQNLAFDSHIDDIWRLAARQVAVNRAAMPGVSIRPVAKDGS